MPIYNEYGYIEDRYNCYMGRGTFFFPAREATLSQEHMRPSSTCAPTGIIALKIEERRSTIDEDKQFQFAIISGPGINSRTPVATRYRTKGVFQFEGENWPAGEYLIEITDLETNRSTQERFTLPAANDFSLAFDAEASKPSLACQPSGRIAIKADGITAPLSFTLKQAPGETAERSFNVNFENGHYAFPGSDWKPGDYTVEVSTQDATCPARKSLSFTLPESSLNIEHEAQHDQRVRGCFGGAFTISVLDSGAPTGLQPSFTLLSGPGFDNLPLELQASEHKGLFTFRSADFKAGTYKVKVALPQCQVEKTLTIELYGEPLMYLTNNGRNTTRCSEAFKFQLTNNTPTGQALQYEFALVKGPEITAPQPVAVEEKLGTYILNRQDLPLGDYELRVTETHCQTSIIVPVSFTADQGSSSSCFSLYVDYKTTTAYPCGGQAPTVLIKGKGPDYKARLIKAPEGITVPQDLDLIYKKRDRDELHFTLGGDFWKMGDYTIVVADGECGNCTATRNFTIRETPVLQLSFSAGYALDCYPSPVRMRVDGGSGNFEFKITSGPGITEEIIVQGTPHYTGTYEFRRNWLPGRYTMTVSEAGGCKDYLAPRTFDIAKKNMSFPSRFQDILDSYKLRLIEPNTISFHLNQSSSLTFEEVYPLQMSLVYPGGVATDWIDLVREGKYDFTLPQGVKMQAIYDNDLEIRYRYKGCPEMKTYRHRFRAPRIGAGERTIGANKWGQTVSVDHFNQDFLLPGTLVITEKGGTDPVYTAPWTEDRLKVPSVLDYNKDYTFKFIDRNGIETSANYRMVFDFTHSRGQVHSVHTACGEEIIGYEEHLYLTTRYRDIHSDQGRTDYEEDFLPLETVWIPNDGTAPLRKTIWPDPRKGLVSPVLKYNVTYQVNVTLTNGQQHNFSLLRERKVKPKPERFSEFVLEKSGCNTLVFKGINGSPNARLNIPIRIEGPDGFEPVEFYSDDLDRSGKSASRKVENIIPGEYTITFPSDDCGVPNHTLKQTIDESGGYSVRNIKVEKQLTCLGQEVKISADLYCNEDFVEKIEMDRLMHRPGETQEFYIRAGKSVSVTYDSAPMDLDELYTVGYKCPESPTGNIFVKAKNGVAPYTYALVTAKRSTTLIEGTSEQTSDEAVEYEYGEVGQTYTVMIRDACGNTTWENISIKPLDQIGLVAGTHTPEACTGGDIRLFSRGFGSASVYSWIGPNGFVSNEPNPTISNATAAHAGTYVATVRPKGCTATVTQEVQVRVNAPLTTSLSQGQSAQVQNCVGSVPRPLQGGEVQGGVPPYSYQWQRSANGQTGWYDIANAKEETYRFYEPSKKPQTVYYRRLVSDKCNTVPGPVLQVKVSSCWVPVNPHLMHRVAKP